MGDALPYKPSERVQLSAKRLLKIFPDLATTLTSLSKKLVREAERINDEADPNSSITEALNNIKKSNEYESAAADLISIKAIIHDIVIGKPITMEDQGFEEGGLKFFDTSYTSENGTASLMEYKKPARVIKCLDSTTVWCIKKIRNYKTKIQETMDDVITSADDIAMNIPSGTKEEVRKASEDLDRLDSSAGVLHKKIIQYENSLNTLRALRKLSGEIIADINRESGPSL